MSAVLPGPLPLVRPMHRAPSQVKLSRKRADFMDGLPPKITLVVICRPTEPQRELVELLQPVEPSVALRSLGLIRTALYDPEVRAASPCPLLSLPPRPDSIGLARCRSSPPPALVLGSCATCSRRRLSGRPSRWVSAAPPTPPRRPRRRAAHAAAPPRRRAAHAAPPTPRRPRHRYRGTPVLSQRGRASCRHVCVWWTPSCCMEVARKTR
jgi:hypothetical protein